MMPNPIDQYSKNFTKGLIFRKSEVGHYPVEERDRMLLELIVRLDNAFAGERLVSQHLLSQLTGLNVQSVHRSIKRLEKRGCVQRQDRGLILLDESYD